MGFCTNCGTRISDGEPGCPSCGKPVSRPATEHPAQQASPSSPPPQVSPPDLPGTPAPSPPPMPQASPFGAPSPPISSAPPVGPSSQAPQMAPLGPPPPPGYMPPAAAAVPPMALDSDKPPKGGRYGVVGTAGFIGNFILLSIPIIGLIFIFIWAFSKKVNMNRRNMARAMLILGLIGIALAAIVGVLFATIFNGFFDSALDELIRLFQSFSA